MGCRFVVCPYFFAIYVGSHQRLTVSECAGEKKCDSESENSFKLHHEFLWNGPEIRENVIGVPSSNWMIFQDGKTGTLWTLDFMGFLHVQNWTWNCMRILEQKQKHTQGRSTTIKGECTYVWLSSATLLYYTILGK